MSGSSHAEDEGHVPPWDNAPEWTDDCQGKKDFDGEIVSVSTRYWPRGGSADVYDVTPRGVAVVPRDMSVRPSAHSAIVVCGVNVVESDFEGDTEAEVKAAVEKWVAEQTARAVAAVKATFAKDTEGPTMT